MTDNKLPYAETVNYWKTSNRSADAWIEDAKKQLLKVGATITHEAFGREATTGRAGFILGFILNDDEFKVIWPVLPSRTGNEVKAKVQAATFIFYDVKAKCMVAKVMGTRAAFFAYFMLPDGRTASQVGTHEIADALPLLLMAGGS